MSTLETIQALADRLAEVERATEFRVRRVAIPGMASPDSGSVPPGRVDEPKESQRSGDDDATRLYPFPPWQAGENEERPFAPRIAAQCEMALITMDNRLDHTKPTTLGFRGLLNLAAALDEVEALAGAGEIVAVGITGKPFIFAAGADLSLITSVRERAHIRALTEFGHEQMGRLHRLGVPSFAFVNGLALGGGLEVALGCDYRTMVEGASVALPETMLGLVPGWGGCYRLPRLIGAAKAIEVIVANPQHQNTMLSGRTALTMGIADAVFGGAEFLVDSLRWAGQVLRGEITPARPDHTADPAWRATVDAARAQLEARTCGMAPAPDRALDLIEEAQHADEAAGFRAEDNALTDLVMGEESRASIYAFNLVQRRGKKPANAPDPELARKVTKVGVVGAGLMASQIALLMARRLEVPVVMTDVDRTRLDRGLAYVRSEVDKMVAKGRLRPDAANRIIGQVTGTLDRSAYSDAELVIEAVFEELEVKRRVFRELEDVVSSECVLATNTSSLSVTAMAEGLRHPERVVGLHFFIPVAVMPLVEIVRARQTDEATRATAFAVARGLKKTVIGVDDAPAFVVNRLLGRLMSEAGRVVDEGTPIEVVDHVLADLAPMPPFQLMGLVGPVVALHNNESLEAAFGDRFAVPRVLRKIVELGKPGFYHPAKPGEKPRLDAELVAQLEVGDGFSIPGRVRGRVLDALADEARRMIDEGVVADPSDIDLAMITGAGFSFWNGGLLPMLDREGTSELVTGRRFLEPGVASLPS